MKKIAFTICSNNYLGQAQTLANSIIEYNPDYKVLIFLVDKLSSTIDYSCFAPHQIIPIHTIGIDDFDELWKKYNIIELNTCVKASAFKYIFKNYQVDYTFYFDPDIMLFDNILELESEFVTHDILLTPHTLTPIEIGDKAPMESLFLNHGTFNLGFIGVKNTINSSDFLNWWEERLFKLGFNRTAEGLFVDQLWINLVPVFFEKVKTLRSLGYNVAPWNLHERKNIEKINTKYKINKQVNLVFYHFSSYTYKNPENLSKYYPRHNFENCPNYTQIYSEYHKKIIDNKIAELSKQTCYYVEARQKILDRITEEENQRKEEEIKRNRSYVKEFFKLILPPITIKVVRLIQKKIF